MGICCRYFISRENAKDIANITMCKILMNIEQYNPEFAFTTWVSKITVNTILEEFRKNKKHQNIEYVETYYDNASYSDINNANQGFKINKQ
jgi:RNA polymerase sigma-70 factor (ECF subfamily)